MTLTQPVFVAYYRVSTDSQGRSGLGLDAQRVAVTGFVQARGGAIAEEFTEIETGKGSQPLVKRLQLAAALASCRQHRATLLIATLDRLARNVYFISGLMETRVPFVAVDRPDARPFELHISAAMAEEERRMISHRTKAALAAAKRRGTVLGRSVHVLNRQHQARADAFAEGLRPVVEQLRAGGATSIAKLVDALNQENVPTPRGGRWHIKTVHSLSQRLARS